MSTMQLSLKFKTLIIAFFLIIFQSCSKTDPVTGENKRLEPSVEARTEAARAKDGGIFGNIISGGKTNTFDFATSNVLWRATLKTLDFIPLINADYAGGIIIYDWYSETNSGEQIKISIKFLRNEIRSDSLQITAHKKNCIKDEKCSTIKLGNNFAQEIRDNIITEARRIKIEEVKKEKNK